MVTKEGDIRLAYIEITDGTAHYFQERLSPITVEPTYGEVGQPKPSVAQGSL